MNAALSTLAPGASVPVPGGTIPTPIISTANGPVPVVKAPSMATIPQPVPNQLGTSAAVATPTAVASASTGKSAKATSSLPKQSNQIRQPVTGKSFKAIAPPASARPTNAPKVDLMRPRAPPPSKVQCPEAVALRAKRDAIQSKLQALIEKQQRRQQKPSRTPEKARRVSSSTEIPHKPDLPRRRKTHWDRMLQEMSWLATDFIEERKWKASSARTLGAALRDSGFAVVSAKVEDTTKREPAKEKRDASAAKREQVKERKATKIDADEKEYSQVSMEDVRAARKVAKLTASMLSELVNAITEAKSVKGDDECYTKALERYKDRRRKIMEGHESKAPSESDAGAGASDEDNPQCGDVDPKPEAAESTQPEKSCELTFSDISTRVQNLFISSGKKEKLSFKDFSNATIEKKFSMLDGQKRALEFVDGIWNTSTSGAVMNGMPISGKTVVSCALLWKNRQHGGQLIVCPPSSLVR
mmetsp:Transcript_102256/g.295854  ORF Transcript_102256/g.295854 Transcript_102256/m.295854 type:complete len:472 (-) Transcript_102256:368-1783(-)